MNEDNLPLGNSPVAIPPDRLTRYLGELGDIEATEEQKLELLSIVYSIMRSFVELGFDVAAADIWGSISADSADLPDEVSASAITEDEVNDEG